jgi:hypothetical protein
VNLGGLRGSVERLEQLLPRDTSREEQYLPAPSAPLTVARRLLEDRYGHTSEKLSRLLFEQARTTTTIDVHALDDDDYVEDYLMIDRIEPGALWFEGDIGPVKVPKAASEIAQPGWSVNVVLARVSAEVIP